jgi:hypothetical protein
MSQIEERPSNTSVDISHFRPISFMPKPAKIKANATEKQIEAKRIAAEKRKRKLLNEKAEDFDGFLDENKKKQRANREKYPDKTRTYQVQFHNSVIGRFTEYKTNARRYRRYFGLTFEEFKTMVEADCFYCLKRAIDTETGLNGIDRLDSELGYDFKNCKPACSECNMSKHTLSPKFFVAQTLRIVNHYDKAYHTLTQKNSVYEQTSYYSKKGSSIGKYRCDSKEGKIVFDLSPTQFNDITKQSCYLCGNVPPNGKCGIDKVNPKGGYVITNCKPCCHSCNIMKRDHDLTVFLNNCRRVVDNFSKNDIDLPDVTIENRPTTVQTGPYKRKKAINLTARERSKIVLDLKISFPNFVDVETRIQFNIGTPEDVAFMEHFEAVANKALQDALIKKITDHNNKTKIDEEMPRNKKAKIQTEEQ